MKPDKLLSATWNLHQLLPVSTGKRNKDGTTKLRTYHSLFLSWHWNISGDQLPNDFQHLSLPKAQRFFCFVLNSSAHQVRNHLKQDRTQMPDFSQLSGPATNTRQLLLVPAAAKTEISAVYSTTILVDIAPEPMVSTSGISDLLYLENQKHLKKNIHLDPI